MIAIISLFAEGCVALPFASFVGFFCLHPRESVCVLTESNWILGVHIRARARVRNK